jgi:uncharacterized protein (TIGR02145 family)
MKRNVFLLLFIICFLTGYGQRTGTFTDTRDGKVYKTVKIGDQIWFAENLSFKADSGCWAYDDNEKFATIYGYLYSFRTAEKVCPKGWHLPTDAEWKQLIDYLGGDSIAGAKLKSVHGWNSKSPGLFGTTIDPFKLANNSSGFSALPGGERYYGDTIEITEMYSPRYHQIYDHLGQYTGWWGGYKGYRDVGTIISLYFDSAILFWNSGNMSAHNVRCIKDK